MAVIYVKTTAGRVARSAPKGKYIPHDDYVAVQDTDYMKRRIHVGDVQLQPKTVEAKSKVSTPATPAAPVATEPTK